MAALNTNLLVRWLEADEQRQVLMIEHLLSEAVLRDERLCARHRAAGTGVGITLSRYDFDKSAISTALDTLLSTAEQGLQEEAAVERALWHFRSAPASAFADALHLALSESARRGPLLTLDKKAGWLAGAQMVT